MGFPVMANLAKQHIQDLHTKTVQSGGSFVGQIGEFLHVVAFGEQGRAELLERLNSKSGRKTGDF